ncbi:MAG: hypothetical protein QXU54_00305 [Candidatus Micrarchaeia archaeon]
MSDLSNLVKEATSRKMPEYTPGKDDPNIIEGGGDAPEDVPTLPKSSLGSVKVELPKSGYRTGQSVKGTVTVTLKEPKKAESLVVVLWGEKRVALPSHFRTPGGNNDSRVVRVSERFAELTGARELSTEEKFQFELPVAAPVPDLAANYKWYVGASLILWPDTEIADMIEIKVVDA